MKKKLRGAAAKAVANKGKKRSKKRQIRCGNCRKPGHNTRTCKA
jgi:hypothetical protein